MSAGVKLSGLASLQHFFATAADDLRAEAMVIVRETTEQAASEIRRAYPTGTTGHLKGRVRTHYPTATVLAGVVSSAAPHASLYEFGTKTRRTQAGANRGRMPAHPTTPKIAQRLRSGMEQRLRGVVRAAGFEIDDER